MSQVVDRSENASQYRRCFGRVKLSCASVAHLVTEMGPKEGEMMEDESWDEGESGQAWW